MTVTIAGKRITARNELSAPAQYVLGLIDGGNEWLSYALAAPAGYVFADEAALVSGIQQGLHGLRLTLLPLLGLFICPARLMLLSADDLQLLTLAESGGEAPVDRVQQLLAAQQFATAADLAAVDAGLAALGVADAPLFQAMDLADRVALRALLAEADGNEASKEAGAFALSWARTPLEFADYFRAFLSIRAAAPSLAADAVPPALLALLPILFGVLDCPNVGGIKPAAEVSAAIANWLESGRQLGFARLSLAAAQVAANTGFATQPGTDDAALVATYMAQARTALANGEIGSVSLSQDGASAYYDVTSDTGDARLVVDATGTIALAAFRPAAAAAA